MTYSRDYKFDHANFKYCGGVYNDGRHMYVMLISDKDVGNHYKVYIYKKDIIYYSDDHLKSIDLASTISVVTPLINTFVVKTENNIKTLFFAGSTDALGPSSYITGRSNFVMKFSIGSTDFTCLT
jgi:hypothetical protein